MAFNLQEFGELNEFINMFLAIFPKFHTAKPFRDASAYYKFWTDFVMMKWKSPRITMTIFDPNGVRMIRRREKYGDIQDLRQLAINNSFQLQLWLEFTFELYFKYVYDVCSQYFKIFMKLFNIGQCIGIQSIYIVTAHIQYCTYEK